MEKLKLDKELQEWDAAAENDKAVFMEYLYYLYKPKCKTYTGLWQQYLLDTALKGRDFVLSEAKRLKDPNCPWQVKANFPEGFVEYVRS